MRRIDKRTICSLRVAFAFLSAVASCTPSENAAVRTGPTNEQSDFIRLDETGVAKLRTSEAEARSLATDDAFKRLVLAVPGAAWDHRADATVRAHDVGPEVLDNVTRAFPAAFEFMGYSGWPWSKTIAIDGEGETIILNRRKIPEASSADYAGTIWHELSHKAGYFHTGNGRRGNECTVPHLLGDAAVVAAVRSETGTWAALPADACPGLRQALVTVSAQQPSPAVAVAPAEPTSALVRARPLMVASEFGRPSMRAARTSGSSACTGAAGGPGEFSLYVLALSWAPEFCAAHGDKGECSPLSDFASTHLTIHGLWPNYDDSQSASMGCEYPQYCDDTAGCAVRNPPDSCNPSASSIPAIMSKYGPGYVSDHDFLANHEWPKHGVCSGLGEADYFASAVTALTGLGGDSGTPAALASAIGGAISPAALKGAFHVASSILLSCDAQCDLTQVGVCLAHDGQGRPTAAVACPENATTSASDNGCVTRQCATIHVRTLAQASGGPPGGSTSGGSCSHPGQGPACSSNESCVAAGFARCARSGCCTSAP